MPYLPGLGWAEEGQLWVTMSGDLSIDIDPPVDEDELAYYRPTGGALTFALDGSAPDQVNQSYEFGVLSFRVAFAVPVDQRAFTLLATGELAGQLYDSADDSDLPPTASTPLSVAMPVEVPG